MVAHDAGVPALPALRLGCAVGRMHEGATVRSYTWLRRWIRSIAVLLVLTMVPSGLAMADTLDDALRRTLYQAHLLVGWLVVALAIWRVVLRFRQRVAAPSVLAPWNRRALHVVHRAVAVFPLLLAVSGVGAIVQDDLLPVLQAGEAPPATLEAATARTGHQIGAYLFTAPLVVHDAGIVLHQVRSGGRSRRCCRDVAERTIVGGSPTGAPVQRRRLAPEPEGVA